MNKYVISTICCIIGFTFGLTMQYIRRRKFQKKIAYLQSIGFIVDTKFRGYKGECYLSFNRQNEILSEVVVNNLTLKELKENYK